ncbi:MAG: RsmB/NOP family class I SAM-dependent RNA methyltransferase [Caulobacteraceae bacterium]|nr:RsmB/NOP family class I SAM-dependent RNA methyltransferase [Caulobacteraceae bacterium]
MGEENDRARVLGALRFVWNWDSERIGAASADEHGPGALTAAEVAALSADPIPPPLGEGDHPKDGGGGVAAAPASPKGPLSRFATAPPEGEQLHPERPAAVAGDYPDWLDASLARVFGDDRSAEGAALAERAPVDLRVNALKTDAARGLKAVEALGGRPAGAMALALRFPAPSATDRAPPIEAAPEFAKGWFEVQDLGSQIAAAAAGEVKGRQVLDFCAGGGGKTLALAAMMANTGQLYAYDADARRLTETVTRAQRAGVRNLQVRSPLRAREPLAVLEGLDGRMDLVFVDAPCTGSGTWRRHPDAKWRLGPAQLARRMEEQSAVLAAAAGFVKPGGRMVYVTCSLLMEENEDRLAAFLGAHADFAQANALAAIEASGQLAPGAAEALAGLVTPEGALRLTPRSAGTDGFFVAVLQRRP